MSPPLAGLDLEARRLVQEAVEAFAEKQDAEDRLHDVRITVNRNAIPFDPRPPRVTSGLRIGSPALATRGLGVEDFVEVGKIIARTLPSLFSIIFDALQLAVSFAGWAVVAAVLAHVYRDLVGPPHSA